MIEVGLLLVLLTATPVQPCAAPSRLHKELHWSSHTTFSSPDHRMQIEVRPVFDPIENKTSVILHACGTSGSWPLFTLERDADIFWRRDSTQILVIDEYLSGGSRIALLGIKQITIQASTSPFPNALDSAIREAVKDRLGKNSQLGFYLPTMVSWKGDTLIVAVGGNGDSLSSGPSHGYCYGFVIDSATASIQEVIGERALRARTGRSCIQSP